ncbi:DUF2971 domain-containing protein [Filimonas effusa]|uniref:DUF2971 domain-containing protein n=1 Tax=Filimonas effusa TaxID=2508721 RepID=A0A4Q1DEH3_9BACT|nr:DUF2971 domain-containing protein [Filimonas effusa]RXK87009.1 DUF2971 domain-containing protein [Filimonas effusa]
MTKPYIDFKEVEQSIRENAPAVVYKYRTWKDDNHKNLHLKRQVWFSHPYDLNDPLDVRPEFAYDADEVNSEAFYQRLIAGMHELFPETQFYPPEIQQRLATEKWDQIKENPKGHFDANRAVLEKREHYDPYGIFSTSVNGLSVPTWEHYGDNYTGYCVGFRTVDLCRELNCTAAMVEYNDAPYMLSFTGKRDGIDILLYKKTSWSHEEEFRFATVGVGIYYERLREFDPQTVAEVIIGHNMPPKDMEEVIASVKKIYPVGIPIYQTVLSNGVLSKNQIA